jgi:hypothetical protein
MKARIWIPAVMLCAATVCIGLVANADTSVPDTLLSHVHGGSGWDCMFVASLNQCAPENQTGECDVSGPLYCTDTTKRSSCSQNQYDCIWSQWYTGCCETPTVPCPGTYVKYACRPRSYWLCDWEDLGDYECCDNPVGPTTMQACNET